ncbi:urotensin-2 [Pelodytes ibericus]
MYQSIMLCFLLVSLTSPSLSLPLIDSSEDSYQLPGKKMELRDINHQDGVHIRQTLPTLLEKHRVAGITDDYFSTEGLGLGIYSIDGSIRGSLFGRHPRISLLNRLQTKERKQYKKRAGNLSECFWKYCV